MSYAFASSSPDECATSNCHRRRWNSLDTPLLIGDGGYFENLADANELVFEMGTEFLRRTVFTVANPSRA